MPETRRSISRNSYGVLRTYLIYPVHTRIPYAYIRSYYVLRSPYTHTHSYFELCQLTGTLGELPSFAIPPVCTTQPLFFDDPPVPLLFPGTCQDSRPEIYNYGVLRTVAKIGMWDKKAVLARFQLSWLLFCLTFRCLATSLHNVRTNKYGVVLRTHTLHTRPRPGGPGPPIFALCPCFPPLLESLDSCDFLLRDVV